MLEAIQSQSFAPLCNPLILIIHDIHKYTTRQYLQTIVNGIGARDYLTLWLDFFIIGVPFFLNFWKAEMALNILDIIWLTQL